MTSIDAIEIQTGRSAANVRDVPSRAALAEQFRQAATLAAITEGGLALAAADIGLRVDRGVAAHLQLIQMVLGELAEKIDEGDVFNTHEEYLAIDAERAAFAAQLAENPVYMVTGSQLDELRTAAREAVHA